MALSERVSEQRPSARLEFAELFHQWDFIESDTVKQPAWRRTKAFPLSTSTLLRRWQSDRQLLGVSFGDMTRYGLLDIDDGSPYHPTTDPEAFHALCSAFEEVGLTRSLLVRSSNSGGLHLYFPLPSKVKPWSLAALLHVTSALAGFDIKPGTLELFPNVKQWATNGDISLYKAHRLPLQQGSCLLDGDGQPITTDLTSFMTQWVIAANNQDALALRKALKSASHRTDLLPFHHPRSRKASDFYKDDEAVIEQGWTQRGQTNEILCAIARHLYVFHDKSGDELALATAETARSRPGFEQYCSHKLTIEKRSRHWADCVQRRYYPYGSQKTVIPDDAPNPNDLRRASARERIRAAVAAYHSSNDFPSGITDRATLLASNGLSLSTLYRHKDLWHPDFVNAASVIEPPSVIELPIDPIESTLQPLQPAPAGSLQAIAPKKFVRLREGENNKQPREKDSTDLEARMRQAVGEDWSDTLARAIANQSPEIVEDALAALLQQRERTTILNPGAWLACAIRAAWKPNFCPQPSSQLSPQLASLPEQSITAEPEVSLPSSSQAHDGSVDGLPDCVREALAAIKMSRQERERRR